MTCLDSDNWRDGYGVIRHKAQTLEKADKWLFAQHDIVSDDFGTYVRAADQLANAAMWVAAHMTYANRVDLSGAPLGRADFKPDPQGHLGGSLNLAIAFSGYLLANLLSGHTRGWLLGQGHCVSAIEAINALTDDVSLYQEARYDRTQSGLSQLVKDFYSYAITRDGLPGVPLGSHVNAHTAGGSAEGGYLGFASLQYVHTPLKGERLIAFLSDGAFEEQRGSDWSPRWWRSEDCGLSVPVMILNGRRIEQHSQIGQSGGADWFEKHLELSGFHPIRIDGHDPLAYALAIMEAEHHLQDFLESGAPYPARLPYVIAECIKGFGFPGAGKNTAHNLPLNASPFESKEARDVFNQGAAKLFVPPEHLDSMASTLAQHEKQQRLLESCHPIACRLVSLPSLPRPKWSRTFQPAGPMDEIDGWFTRLVVANPQLRVRVGNPDELRSNHMGNTLTLLKHRTNHPEDPEQEHICGKVITALNEEAVISAVLANKGGLNLAVSYEAFAMKMLGALRQDIIFARRQKEIGKSPGWISLPLIVSSHTWENAKNEQSHQDPTLPEALLGEMSDTSRVLFPIDANTAVAALQQVYSTHGEIHCLVVPKRPVTTHLSGEAAKQAIRTGAAHLLGDPATAKIQLVSVGAYQAEEALRAAKRLTENGIETCVTCVIEPGQLRLPRDKLERKFTMNCTDIENLFPCRLPRIIISHTRPEPMLGHLRRIDPGPHHCRAHGYINRGGTFSVSGMLFANRSSWAHIVGSVKQILEVKTCLLSSAEQRAVDGQGDPHCLYKD